MDTLTAIATRRSTRMYKPEQISDSQLQTVLAAGWASPVENYLSLLYIIPRSSKITQITAARPLAIPNTILFTAHQL